MITTRLQLASRIQLVLFRELGEKIDIEQMLANERYARDVLLLCDTLRGEEVAGLAQRYRELAPHAPGHEPQSTEWSAATTGFGVTRPMEDKRLGLPAPKQGGWLAATRRWLRR